MILIFQPAILQVTTHLGYFLPQIEEKFYRELMQIIGGVHVIVVWFVNLLLYCMFYWLLLFNSILIIFSLIRVGIY